MAEVASLPPATRSRPTEQDQDITSLTTSLTTTAAQTDSPTADTDGTLIASNPETKKLKKVMRKKRRPARPQQDPALFKSEPPPQTGTIFNIWYNKWSGGDREDSYLSKHAAHGRCNVAKDSGYTRADSVPGSYFCLFFARGLCPKGQECEYLHRLPNSRTEKEGGLGDIFQSNVDCFGRDKFSDYRDDMGGVGSFMRVNRTLYVGRIHVTDDIEEVVARHFQEWGQVERIRVLPTRGVAFVTYTHLANSEFAKEAMAHQSLDHAEVLNVRWATVDPNPAAQKREVAKIEEQAAEAIRRALPAAYVAEIEGRGIAGAYSAEELRKRRKIEGSFGLQGFEAPDEVWYAREKALADASQGQMALEAPEEDADELLQIQGVRHKETNGSESGILSGSTLAALRGYTAAVAAKAPDKPPGGPLVGYGSDDESE